MALKQCKECGEKVSTKAKACPSCGAVLKKERQSIGCGGLILILIIIGIFGSIIGGNNSSKTNTTSTQTNTTKIKTKKPVNTVKPKAVSSWRTHVSKDEMTGKKSSYANSISVSSTQEMDFPYHDVKAWIGVGCNGSNEWVYVGFTKSPNLNNDETEDGYNLIKTRIKWDDRVDTATLTQDWGDKFLSFSYDKPAISNILKSNSVMLELNWHGSGRTFFKFPLNGSSAAIKTIRQNCSGK